MKKVIINSEKETICLTEINENVPIFFVRVGEVKGLLVKENDNWIVRIGGNVGSAGHHSTREKAIRSTLNLWNGSYFCIKPEVK